MTIPTWVLRAVILSNVALFVATVALAPHGWWEGPAGLWIGWRLGPAWRALQSR